ncbi:2-hydroxymuconate tautomerase [Arthrobacter sp. NPDC093139]|jgi:4-oxalocrotonate tautomerase|uniref:2-hydroxymuconate tautomerase n=1 Tax=Arthrobacter sp. NPDC093139 TaxID=3363945 RepID=UPI00380EFE2D
MPVVQVHMRAGRSAEEKRQLINALTDAVVRVLGSKRERIVVLLDEIDPESWGQGGRLLIDELSDPEET